MTTLIYKLSEINMGKTKHALRLYGFCSEDSDKFKIELPSEGKAIVGHMEQQTEKRIAIFSKKAFPDGVHGVRAVINGKLFTAEPLLFDEGEIYPAAAGAEAVIKLCHNVDTLEERIGMLSKEISMLHEKIGTKEIFKII